MRKGRDSLLPGCSDSAQTLHSLPSQGPVKHYPSTKPLMPSDRTKGKGHTLKYRRSCLNTLSVTMHWPTLPKDTVESPFLEILKNNLDVELCRALSMPQAQRPSLPTTSGQDSQLFSLKRLQEAVLLNPSGEEPKPSLFTEKLSQNPYHFSNMKPKSTDKATSQGRRNMPSCHRVSVTQTISNPDKMPS